MAKTRINKNEKRRLYEKQQYAVATQVRMMAEQLANQAQLDTMLLQVEDPVKRRAMFDFVKPFLKFPNPEFPTTLAKSLIIRP